MKRIAAILALAAAPVLAAVHYWPAPADGTMTSLAPGYNVWRAAGGGAAPASWTDANEASLSLLTWGTTNATGGAIDLSGAGHHGTASPNAATGPVGNTIVGTNVNGVLAYAMDYDGGTDAQHFTGLGTTGAIARTVCAWIWPDTDDTVRDCFFSAGSTASPLLRWILYCDLSVNANQYTTYGGHDYYSAASTVTYGKWNFVAVQYLGGGWLTNATQRIYINGVEKSVTAVRTAWGYPATADSNQALGRDRPNNNYGFDGRIGKVRVYKGYAPTVAELGAIMSNTCPTRISGWTAAPSSGNGDIEDVSGY